MHSRRQLVADLKTLGLARGDVVMAHASVRAVGEVAGGPDEIHLAIKDVITSEGTLLMYAGCPRYVDEVGRGNLTPSEEAEVLAALPSFDAQTARSARDHGILVEFLRTWPESRVNTHVARFVAWGRQADSLFSSQPWNYAFGHDSALDRFAALDGRILLLGSDHDAVTFLHYVEHIADIPGRRVARFRVPIAENGRRVWREMEECDTSGAGAHANWPDRLFARLVDGYLSASHNRGGPVGAAWCYLLPARGLLQFARPVMERLAVDSGAADALHELPGVDVAVDTRSANEPVAGIDALYTAWRDAFRRRDVEAVLNLLTDDYLLWASGLPPMTRATLGPQLAAAFERYDVVPAFEREERIVSGALAFERGWDVQIVRPRDGDGEPNIRRQRVFLVLRRDADGHWRFARGMSDPTPDGSHSRSATSNG